MLRTYKIYTQPGRSIEFTSRPGDIQSKDDFYLVHSTSPTKLIVMETSFNTYNQSLYDRIQTESVPSWIRA